MPRSSDHKPSILRSADVLLTRTVKLHLYIASAQLALLVVLAPLLRRSAAAYADLADETSLRRALQADSHTPTHLHPNDALLSLSALILPHALNNAATFNLSLSKVFRSGVFANLFIVLVAFVGTHILRILALFVSHPAAAQREASEALVDKETAKRGWASRALRWLGSRRIAKSRLEFCARTFVSLVVGADVALLVVCLSSLLLKMHGNFKVPLWPFSVWPDLIGKILATHRVHPVTYEGWANVDFSLLAKVADLASLQRFTTFAGLRTLRSLFASQESMPRFLADCFLRTLSDFVHGFLPLTLCLIGLIFIDLLPLIIKLRTLKQSLATPISGADPLRGSLLLIQPLKRVLVAPFVYFLATLAIAAFFLVQYPSCTMTDDFSHLHPSSAEHTTHGPQYLLFTRSMSGSSADVRISVDVFLPPSILLNFGRHLQATNTTRLFLEEARDRSGEQSSSFPWRTPTFFSATRYNRRMTLRWPFSGLKVWGQEIGDMSAAIFTWPLTRGLVHEGLPVVVMDARGTGASTGVRMLDLDRDEVEDFRIVADWAKRQPWSNGILAGGGVSYDGLTSLKLAAVDDSPLDITAAMYSPLHPVTDLLQNNGMASRAFVDDYSGLTSGFEKRGSPLVHWLFAEVAHIPLQIKLGFIFAFRLPLPARGWEETLDRRSLTQQRQLNWDMKRIADTTMFSDDSVRLLNGKRILANDGGVTLRDLSRIVERKMPTYWSAGECDSTGARRVEDIFSKLDHKRSFHRLVIGPWGHGGRRGCGTEPLQGSWACADYQGIRDMAAFVKEGSQELLRQRRSPSPEPHLPSTRFVYVNSRLGGAWHTRVVTGEDAPPRPTSANPPWKPQTAAALPGMTLGLGSEMLPAEWINPTDITHVDTRASLALRHLLTVPKALLLDLRAHTARGDFAGVAHDLSEILLVLGSRLNRIMRSTRVILRSLHKSLVAPVDAGLTKSRTDLTAVGGVRILSKEMSSDFATTGSLSRWSIVQHLMRYPVDSDHSIACSANLRRLLDSVRLFMARRRGHPALSSVLEFVSKPFETDVAVEGSLRLQIPFLLLREDLPVTNRGDYLDWAVIAIVQEEMADESPPDPRHRTYVSEGRAVVSLRSGGSENFGNADLLLRNITGELRQSLQKGPALSAEDLRDDGALSRTHFMPASLPLHASRESAEGMLVFVRFQMEAVNRLMRRGTRLRLTLLPEDQTNFPWKRTASKMAAHRELFEHVEQRLGRPLGPPRQLTRWRIPLAAADEATSRAGWLYLPTRKEDYSTRQICLRDEHDAYL